MLSRALAAYIDEQFVDPVVTGVTDESPWSITFGVSPVAVTGDADVDIANLVAAYVAGGARLETAAFLLSSENAIALRLLGGDIFRDLTVSVGLLAGVPAYASSSVGDPIVLADRARVLVADTAAVASTRPKMRRSNSATIRRSRVPSWVPGRAGRCVDDLDVAAQHGGYQA